MFGNHAFQVKFVKEKQSSGQPLVKGDAVDSVLVAQSYADLAVNTATQFAKLAVIVIGIKAGCDFINTVARSFAK